MKPRLLLKLILLSVCFSVNELKLFLCQTFHPFLLLITRLTAVHRQAGLPVDDWDRRSDLEIWLSRQLTWRELWNLAPGYWPRGFICAYLWVCLPWPETYSALSTKTEPLGLRSNLARLVAFRS